MPYIQVVLVQFLNNTFDINTLCIFIVLEALTKITRHKPRSED